MCAKTAKRFCPPTPEDVRSYVEEKGYVGFDVERFIDHYTSNGWMVGRNKMKDWRAAARNWRKNETKYDGQKKPREHKVNNKINDEWDE